MKLKAFTILEMTVVMLITMLVVSFGYGGYLMISKHYHKKIQYHNEIADVSRLRQVLNHEFFQSDTIKWDQI